MDYSVIYKLKQSRDKLVVLTKDYVGFQDYITENRKTIALHVIKKNDDIWFYTDSGIIVFDLHLRLSIVDFEVLNFIAIKSAKPLILIGHPVMNQYNILNELRHNFKIVSIEEPE